MKELVIRTASQVQQENKLKIEFLVGTMMNYPERQLKQRRLLNTQNSSVLEQMI